MTLDQLACGDAAQIASIDGGLGIRRRLEALGIYPGDRVKMIQVSAFRGPVLVEAGGRRLAIGRGVSWCTPQPPQDAGRRDDVRAGGSHPSRARRRHADDT